LTGTVAAALSGATVPDLDPDACAVSMPVLTDDRQQADGFDRRVYAVVAARRATTCAIPGRSGLIS